MTESDHSGHACEFDYFGDSGESEDSGDFGEYGDSCETGDSEKTGGVKIYNVKVVKTEMARGPPKLCQNPFGSFQTNG